MKYLASIAVLATLATGCMTNSTKISYDGCTYNEAPEYSAPTWLCGQPVEGLEIQAFGYSKKLGAGPGMMRDVAVAEARSELAATFRAHVSSRLDSLTRSELEGLTATGAEDSDEEASTSINERVQRNLATMDITGSRIHFIQNSPKGGMYVLVGLDEKAYEENIDRLMNTTFEEDGPQMFREFLLENANTALDSSKESL